MKDRITCNDVKPIRDFLEINQRELADMLGCTQQVVFAWEKEPEGSQRRIHPMFANQLRKLKKQMF